MDIKQNIIHSDTTIRTIMAKLDDSFVKLCVLVDCSGCLFRTVNDGDIRRAFLAGASMDSPASIFPPQRAVTRQQGASQAEITSAFTNDLSIHAVVLVDVNNKPVGMVSRSEAFTNILLSPPHLGKTESDYVLRAFEENWIAPAGPNLNAFEEALKSVSGRSHAIALSSGTAGLHLALRVLNVSVGDTVYVSDLTFAASVQPVFYQGAIPILIDCEPKSWNMSPDALERRLQQDQKSGCLPKAIIVAHLYGQSADIDGILSAAKRYCVPVIEDAAESLGAHYKNRPSGGHGLLAVYSFNGNKIITTSGGGALVSDCHDLIDRARTLATQGRDSAQHYQHSQVAYNYRMSNVLAGIGLGQLEHLSNRVLRRREIFETYRVNLSDLPGISFQEEVNHSHGNRWLTVISLDPNKISKHPYQLLRALSKDGIESRPAWKPMHMQPLCSNCAFEPHSSEEVVSSRLFLQSLCLPSGTMLSDDQQKRIIARIFDVLGS